MGGGAGGLGGEGGAGEGGSGEGGGGEGGGGLACKRLRRRPAPPPAGAPPPEGAEPVGALPLLGEGGEGAGLGGVEGGGGGLGACGAGGPVRRSVAWHHPLTCSVAVPHMDSLAAARNRQPGSPCCGTAVGHLYDLGRRTVPAVQQKYVAADRQRR
jgi:hypothetical protein